MIKTICDETTICGESIVGYSNLSNFSLNTLYIFQGKYLVYGKLKDTTPIVGTFSVNELKVTNDE